jgi:hypothetical protein
MIGRWQFDSGMRETYRAYSEGRPSPLPALTIQYVDFAVAAGLAWGDVSRGGSITGELLMARCPAGAAGRSTAARRPKLSRRDGSAVSGAVARSPEGPSQRKGQLVHDSAAVFDVLPTAAPREDVVVGSPIAGAIRLRPRA